MPEVPSLRRSLPRTALVVLAASTLGVVGCSTGTEVTSTPTTTAASSTTSTADRTATTADATDEDEDDGADRTTTTERGSADDDETIDTTDDAGGDVTPACDLLTEEDVTDAFGEPVVAGDQRTDECWWSTANDLKTVNLIRRTDEDLQTWREGYDNPQWEAADFGDEGYRGKTLDSIVFRIGDTIYEVNVVFSTKGDPDAVVEALAEQVLTRL